MFNRFKNNTIVLISGYGKCNNKKYKNKIGIVICRDPYFLDYNIRLLEDGTEDWIDGKFLEKFEGEENNESKLS